MIGPSVGSVIWAALTVDIETLLSFAWNHKSLVSFLKVLY